MLEHERQSISQWPTLDELVDRTAQGWKLVALEWEREVERQPAPVNANSLEIPYGLRASPDGFHLVDEPTERRALMLLLNAIVDDRPLSLAAADLNRAGFLNRRGLPWTPAAVFELLPRLIEAGPAIFSSPDWIAQREKHVPHARA